MEAFSYYNPSKLIFGKGSLEKLGAQLKPQEKTVLFHYGQESIKRLGIYQQILAMLQDKGCKVIELGGVQPNPQVDLVRQGIELCRKHNVDILVAAGGGSVIDSAKAIATGALAQEDIWEFFIGAKRIEAALPILAVLTLPATGSETSAASVLTNPHQKLKRSIASDHLRPRAAILDPTYTLSLPDSQTFAGICDIWSHIHERYMTHTTHVAVTDGLCEALMRTLQEQALLLKKDPSNEAARSEVMLAGTLAHGGILGLGREEDWGSHRIAHEITAQYGTTHGVTLSIVMPAWMKYVKTQNPARLARFAVQVMGVCAQGLTDSQVADKGIAAFEEFLGQLGLPLRLSQIGIDQRDFEEMSHRATQEGPQGAFQVLYQEDVWAILKLAA